MSPSPVEPPHPVNKASPLSSLGRLLRRLPTGTQRVIKEVRAWTEFLLLIALVAAAVAALVALARARLSARVYAHRLETVAADYERLRQEYNHAVSRTAVTELRVKGTNVTVVVRTADGQLREFPTSCRADREVYVDYVVLDGRLWIRRVFDAATAPESGTLVDPRLAGVPWDTQTAAVGKAVYRRLDEGRWVVTVSGNGSLGLERASDHTPLALAPPPPVLDFATIKQDVERARSNVSWRDLLRELLRPSAPTP